MTPIPSNFSKHGYTFKLLKRSAAVPEPATYGLMAAGSLFAIILVRRFKK